MSKSPEEIENSLLVLRAQQNNAEALAALVRRWHAHLLAHATRLVNDSHAAEEVMQEVWIAIVRGIAQLNDPAAFKYWSYRIVGRESANWVKRRQRIRREGTSENLDSVTRDDPPPRDSTVLQKSLAALSVLHREVVLLHYLEGLSVQQLAVTLDTTEGTIKSRLHYAREQLRSAWKNAND